jgi:hypothetical protein
MVAYIQQLLRTIIDEIAEWEFKDRGTRFEVLTEELNRLDPRDFPVSQQYLFIELRRQVRQLDKLYRTNNKHWILQRENRDAIFQARSKGARSSTPDFNAKLELELGKDIQTCTQLVEILGATGHR